MRLVCPNCGAQYEVPDNVIPEGGRDVQCSNCGHTWFQRHPDDDSELAEELNEPVPDTEWAPEPEVEEPEPEPDESFEDEQPAPQRRELDPSVTEILREEAEREARARAGQADPLESQPELGLEPGSDEGEEDRRARQARDRMARMRGQDPDAEAAAAAAAAGSRRDLLPDIDEINSTLRAKNDRQDDHDEDEDLEYESLVSEPSKSGFGRGFLFAIILALLLAALYLLAPQITAAVPAAGPTLEAYVGVVDSVRATLNDLVARGLGALGGLGQDAG